MCITTFLQIPKVLYLYTLPSAQLEVGFGRLAGKHPDFLTLHSLLIKFSPASIPVSFLGVRD